MNYLITGGTGSWGYELTKQLLAKPTTNKVVIYSRNEFKQVEMQRHFNNDKLHFIIGDVRDRESLEIACQNIDTVYHLAALKHVPICENQPYEAIKTNIIGTQNVIQASIKNNVINTIFVSTDKAVAPNNLYGDTKAIAERLIIHANTLTNKTKFVCIRAGNVIGSNGSIIPYFKQKIKNDNVIPITDPNMTRYYLSLSKAISLIFKAEEIALPGEIIVMKMPSCSLQYLAECMKEKYGNEDTKIEIIGIREGEKIDEMLISQHEASRAISIDQDFYAIVPEFSNLPKRSLLEYTKIAIFEYSSNPTTMDKKEIMNMLNKYKESIQ